MYSQAGVAARLQVCIRDVLGSNRGGTSVIPTGVSPGFPQTLEENDRKITISGHNLILPNTFLFTIHQLSYYKRYIGRAIYSAVK
jgi:hypothetical protein